jgi:hypothetical protein
VELAFQLAYDLAVCRHLRIDIVFLFRDLIHDKF